MSLGIKNNEQVSAQNNNVEKNNLDKKRKIPIYLTAMTAGSVGGSCFTLAANGLAKKNFIKTSVANKGIISANEVDNIFNSLEITKKYDLLLVNQKCTSQIVDTLEEEVKALTQEYDTYNFVNKIKAKMKKYANEQDLKNYEMIIKGQNARYLDEVKGIMLNKENGGALLFHELGHAKNFNATKGLGHGLAKFRSSLFPTLLIATGTICALLPKYEGEEAETVKGRICNTLKKCSLGITAIGASAIPLEEALASYNGYKIAKSTLSADKVSKIAKMNGKAWLTYAAIAAGSILTTWITGKVADKIRERNKSIDEARALKNTPNNEENTKETISKDKDLQLCA